MRAGLGRRRSGFTTPQTSLATLAMPDLATLKDDELLDLAAQALDLQHHDRQTNQLHYYRPANPTIGRLHTLTARIIGIGGGNRAGKTDHALVELVIRVTGQIPQALHETYPRSNLRGPIAARVVCESLTTTLYPVILPKLQWWRWNGPLPPDGSRGHWGWIPQQCLVDGSWKHSWSEKLRVLKVLYRDTEHPERVVGESTIQFMSKDQDPSDFSGVDLNFILHDEPPTEEIWRESRTRVMGVDGTLMVSMTWPDNPSINVDWLFDEVYNPGQPGPGKDQNVEWINIFSTDNPHIDQSAVADMAARMTPLERQVRIFGQPIRFSNRIHPLFTDQARHWCFMCMDDTMLDGTGGCVTCQSDDVISYTHVQPCPAEATWPVVMAIDPHPRKPHMMLWAQVTPNDDLQVVVDSEVEGGPEAVRDEIERIESEFGWSCITRLMDPNMGRSPSGAQRELTWQDEFDNVGIRFDLADDSDVGRARVNEMLQPDRATEKPRLVIDPRCVNTIFQIKRYTWDEHKRVENKDIKQTPRQKYDDYPTLLKYIANSNPQFRQLKLMGSVFPRAGRKGGLY